MQKNICSRVHAIASTHLPFFPSAASAAGEVMRENATRVRVIVLSRSLALTLALGIYLVEFQRAALSVSSIVRGINLARSCLTNNSSRSRHSLSFIYSTAALFLFLNSDSRQASSSRIVDKNSVRRNPKVEICSRQRDEELLLDNDETSTRDISFALSKYFNT